MERTIRSSGARGLMLMALFALVACDGSPIVQVSGQHVCTQAAETMVSLATACGQSKRSDRCIEESVAAMCPEVTGYEIYGSGNRSAWIPCSEAKSIAAKAECAKFTEKN